MEGVLTPEIWLHVRDRSGVAELNLTTRDVKDYRELMDRRVEICARHGVSLKDIQSWVSELEVLPGAREFTDWARSKYQLVILSDTFYAFADNFMRQLGSPTLFCHDIRYERGADDAKAGRLVYTLRQENQKMRAVEALRSLNFRVAAAGVSYNYVYLLMAADVATLFRAPEGFRGVFPDYKNLSEFSVLW
jgi:phosphoserine/homoserine phosphotransferase